MEGSARKQLMSTELLDRAAQLFAERGFAGTTLQEIADAMGLSRPALYHYIRSKDDLLGQLVAGSSRDAADALTAIRRGAEAPADKLAAAIDDMIRRITDNPTRFKLLDRSEGHLPEPAASEHEAAKRRVLAELVTVIEQGVVTGEFRPVSPRTTALGILGMCNWVAWWYRPDQADAQRVVRSHTDFALRGLLAREDGGERTVSDSLATIREELDRLERLTTANGRATPPQRSSHDVMAPSASTAPARSSVPGR